LKIVIKNTKAAPGIVEWEVIKSDDLDMNEGEEDKEENPPAPPTTANETPNDSDKNSDGRFSIVSMLIGIAICTVIGVGVMFIVGKKKR
jgi:hypothetical protein